VREFVWWYNGHPDCAHLSPDLKSSDTVVVLGQGNVALDVARVLLQQTTELAKTDIASHALASLEGSSVRRGPAQAACTARELRELLGLNDLNVHIKEADLRPDRVIPSDDNDGHVAGVHFEKTVLQEVGDSSKQVTVGIGQFEDLVCRMVLKSIGHKSVPVDGLPFDNHKGIVSNIQGRVINNVSDGATQIEKGLYVVGWLKIGCYKPLSC
ncbi:hypothetical protein RJ641_026872, partial [Dillenia turbinata]